MKYISILLLLCSTALIASFYSQHTVRQRAGFMPDAESRKTAKPLRQQLSSDIRARRGPGRPGGSQRQRWAERDFVPQLDMGGARNY